MLQHNEKIAKLYPIIIDKKVCLKIKVSQVGVVALWDDCTFFPADFCWQSQKMMICTIYQEFNKLDGNGPLNIEHLHIIKSNGAPILIS